MATFRIYATAKNDPRFPKREKVDETTSRSDARYLVGEYALAMGRSHTITCVPDPFEDPRERHEDDGRSYGHPGDRLRGRE